MSRTSVFVITGAGSGIGQAITGKLAALGYSVIGVGRSREKLELSGAPLPSGRFWPVAADLSEATSTKVALAQIRERLAGRSLVGLVNNAGVFDRIPFRMTPDEVWERHFHNNLLSAARLTRELYPELKAGAPSSVLNISSSLGRRPVGETAAYSAMKAAMINWTETLALEWAPDGIRANCICPGLVDTPIHGFKGENDPRRAGANAAQPLGRMGHPNEIAEAAAFLLSPSSAWTTGATLTVDGGISL